MDSSSHKQLKNIANWMKELDYPCKLIKSSSEIPIDRLAIELSLNEKQDNKAWATLYLQPQEMLPEAPNSETLYRAVLEIPLETTASLTTLVDTMRTILYLNALSDLPGWQLNPVTFQLGFRLVQLLPDSAVQQIPILSWIGNAAFQVSLFLQAVKWVAEGQLTFIEFLEKSAKNPGSEE